LDIISFLLLIFESIKKNKSSTNSSISFPCKLPLEVTVTLRTPQFKINEEEFENALIDYSINDKKCVLIVRYINGTRTPDSYVQCSENEKKDENSLLRLSDLWIRLSSCNETDPIMGNLLCLILS
jgi:hypothetical protein